MSATDPTPEPPPVQQLQMLFPAERLGDLPEPTLPEGYRMRTYQPGDEEEFVALMHAAGFGNWTEQTLKDTLLKVLPKGLFLVVAPDGALAATTMATHCPAEHHPFGGELGWVGASPAHQGKHLGRAVCLATLRRYARAEYTRIYLRTDDWRLPAIKTYFGIGFQPFFHLPDMPERWRAVCEKLSVPFEPDRWPTVLS